MIEHEDVAVEVSEFTDRAAIQREDTGLSAWGVMDPNRVQIAPQKGHVRRDVSEIAVLHAPSSQT